MKKKIGTHATVTKIVDDQFEQTKGKVLQFDGEPAVVRVSQGATLNMGNYSSLRIGVDLSLPCDPSKIDAAFDKAKAFVEKQLEKLITEHKPKNVDNDSEGFPL